VLDEVRGRGWGLVEADYPGLGTDDPHTYLVGEAEGRSVLDAVRAASAVESAGVEPSSPVLLWGFSQGGHAVLFAAELASSYAPELDVRGVAVSAPVADAAQFWDRAAARQDQLGVTVTIAAGMAAAYPELDLSEVLTDETIAELDVLDGLCIGEVNDHFDRPVDEVLAGDYRDSAAWSRRLDENLTARRQLGYPVLVTQGDQDEIVFPEVSAALAQRLCGHGDLVELRTVAGAGHGDLPPGPTADWLAERLAGAPPEQPCR
jgi:pimeloyl-ACP methyl ester carboxylesterase